MQGDLNHFAEVEFSGASYWKSLLWPLRPREEAEGTQGWISKGRRETVRHGQESSHLGPLDASGVGFFPLLELSFYISKSQTWLGSEILGFPGSAFRPVGEGEGFCRHSRCLLSLLI